jgi:hypothetical protein
MGSKGVARVLVVCLLVVLGAGALAAPAHAEPYPGDRPPGEEYDVGTPAGGSSGNPFFNLIAFVIRGVTWVIAEALNFAKLEPIESLVFNQNRSAQPAVGDAFTQGEWDGAVMPWYKAFRSLALLPALIGIVVAVVGINAVMNPKALSDIGEMTLNALVAAMLLMLAPDLLKFFLMVNGAIVDFLRGQLAGMGLLQTGAAASVMDALKQDPSVNPVMLALVNLNLTVLTLYFNVIYLVRKVVLALMLIALPLVIWTWVGKRTRVPVLTAFSELLTNSLMSASHAIVLAFFFSMLAFHGQGVLSAWWAKLIMLNMVIPLAALLRKMLIGWLNFLGVDEERMAGFGMAGLAGLAGLATVAGSVASSTARSGAGAYAARTAGTTGNAAQLLQPGQNMIQGQVMAFNQGTARVVNADRQGFDVPLSQLPASTRIGDKFNMVLGPEDPSRLAPEIAAIRPAAGPATAGGPRAGSFGHDPGPRATAALAKLVAGGATFGTRAQQPVMELAGSVAYSGVRAGRSLWTTAQREWFRGGPNEPHNA